MLLNTPRSWFVHWSEETDAIADIHVDRKTMQPNKRFREPALFDTPEDILWSENRAIERAHKLAREVYEDSVEDGFEPSFDITPDIDVWKFQVRAQAKADGMLHDSLKPLKVRIVNSSLTQVLLII